MDTRAIQSLISRSQAGDDDAFAELFELHRKTVYSIGYRLVGPDEADDVVMDTFLKAWKAIPRFGKRSTFNTWLYRIAHNCATDALRARKRRHEHVMREDEHDGRTVDDMPDRAHALPGQELADQEEDALVGAAIQQLDDPYRTILLLRFADGLSYAEIAAAMDSSIGTVMSRLFYAKRKLKKLVHELL